MAQEGLVAIVDPVGAVQVLPDQLERVAGFDRRSYILTHGQEVGQACTRARCRLLLLPHPVRELFGVALHHPHSLHVAGALMRRPAGNAGCLAGGSVAKPHPSAVTGASGAWLASHSAAFQRSATAVGQHSMSVVKNTINKLGVTAPRVAACGVQADGSFVRTRNPCDRVAPDLEHFINNVKSRQSDKISLLKRCWIAERSLRIYTSPQSDVTPVFL